MSSEIYTVGHSNRTLGELLALLSGAGVQTLVDVRARPGSRRHPQFSSEALRAGVEQVGIQHHWAGRQLGGMRRPRSGSPHTALAEDGLRGYADYLDTEPFKIAAAQLINLAARAPLAILCAERLPEQCHRSLIADYLTLEGVRVIHLIASGDVREHALSPLLRRESARLVYDRNSQGTLLQ